MENIEDYFKKVEVAKKPTNKDSIDLTIEEFEFGVNPMEFRGIIEEGFA